MGSKSSIAFAVRSVALGMTAVDWGDSFSCSVAKCAVVWSLRFGDCDR